MLHERTQLTKQDSWYCETSALGSETQPRTCNSVDSGDCQQAHNSNVEVPVQGLLNEEGPSVHIDLGNKAVTAAAGGGTEPL